MLARAALVVLAAGLVALGVARTADHRACDAARRDAFAIGLEHRPVSDAAAVATRLEDRCRGAEQLVNGTAAFLRGGATAQAAALAAEAVRREPERRDSWVALSAVRRARGDQTGALRALDRARRLDPVSFRR
jgi:cytochrome c-type biogenesis protein CcmH/NrfG